MRWQRKEERKREEQRGKWSVLLMLPNEIAHEFQEFGNGACKGTRGKRTQVGL